MTGDHPSDDAPTEPIELDERSRIGSLGATEAPGDELDDPGRRELPRIQMGAERYVVLDTLGRGGMGSVFLVHDRDLKRRVALKMLRRSGDARTERFIAESQVMGQLQHPGITPVHELGLTRNKEPYYTMPELRGRTLKTILADLARDDPDTARTWTRTRRIQAFLQIVLAVDYAHAKGVMHRDIKPANVMLGEHGEVQVIDWGLARLLDESEIEVSSECVRAQAGEISGTPWYMAPEQIAGERGDARTDVHALGVVLFELLALRRPFVATPTRSSSRSAAESRRGCATWRRRATSRVSSSASASERCGGGRMSVTPARASSTTTSSAGSRPRPIAVVATSLPRSARTPVRRCLRGFAPRTGRSPSWTTR